MKTINEEFTSFLEIKKSKFFSFLIPFNQFEERLKELKSIHPKANHYVTAFRYLNAQNQIVEGSSDNGEPRGSAGKPTLNVLAGNDLINTGIVTIRYFGGILLGIGGLVKAYSDVAKSAVKNANLIEYKEIFEYTFSVDYEKTRKIEYVIKKNDIFVLDRFFGIDGIEYKIRDDIDKINLIKEKL